jgi:hypothetical protein
MAITLEGAPEIIIVDLARGEVVGRIRLDPGRGSGRSHRLALSGCTLELSVPPAICRVLRSKPSARLVRPLRLVA